MPANTTNFERHVQGHASGLSHLFESEWWHMPHVGARTGHIERLRVRLHDGLTWCHMTTVTFLGSLPDLRLK
jgi:hypothetical protein